MNNKNIENTNDLSVHIGVQSLFSDSTPVSTSKIRHGYFFTLNISKLQQIGANKLSFYLKLKSFYRNGCFYNYSINKIAKLIGCSHATAKKNIQQLIDINLIEIHNGNLSLKKIKKGKCNRKVFVSSKMSLQQIKDKLLLLLIDRKNKQMNYVNNKVNKDALKGLVAVEKSTKHETCNNVIGIRKLSEYLKVSPFYLSNFTKRMIRTRRLKVKRVKVNLGKVSIFNDYVSHYLYKDKRGNTIHYLGSVYSL